MKQPKSRLTALLLGAVLLLSSCSDPGGSENPGSSSETDEAGNPAMGRYIEEECALPGSMIDALHETAAGELECLIAPEHSPQGWGVYRSAEAGKNWEKQDWPALQTFFSQEDRHLTAAIFGEDGGLYTLYYQDDPELTELREEKERRGEQPDFSADYPKNLLAVFSEAGEVREQPLAFQGSDGMAGSELILRLSGEDQLLCAGYRTIYQFDRGTGEVLHIFTCEDQIFNFAVQDEKIFVMAYNEKEIQCFDLISGEELDRIPPPAQLNGASTVISGDRASNALLLSDQTGLYRYVLGGSIWERLVDGDLTSLGLPSLNGRMLCDAADGSYYVLSSLMSGGSIRHLLSRYVFSDAVPAIPQQELTVYALRDNDTIRQAMGQWQRQNPDVRVTFQIGLDDQGIITRSDALRSLNTALLAGKGPDLLVLDSLPHASYVEKGVLQGLSGFLEPMLQKGELLPHVANTYRQDDGEIYAIPARFGVPQLWVSEEGAAHAGSLSEFSEWFAVQKVENCWLYPDLTPEGLMRIFSFSCMPAWRQADGSIQKEPLVAFLEAIRRMCEVDQGAEPISLPEGMSSIALMGLTFTTGGIQVLPGISQGFSDTMNAYAGIGILRDGVCLPLPGQADSLYVPQTILAVNAHSGRQEMAFSLMEAVLSETVQTLDFEDGYPVNAAAFENSWRGPNTEVIDYTFSGETADGTPYSLNIGWPDEEIIRGQADWVRELSNPSEADEVLMEMLLSETKGFFAGEKTAEEAADAVIQRTEAYLAE